MSERTVVELENVTKAYPGGVTALRDVTLTIGYGELVAIVGPSGSGKSTMLHLIGTLDRPSAGGVRIDGHDVATLPDRELSRLRSRRIGFVFQQFHLAPGRSAVANVADGLLYAGVPAKERERRAEAALVRVGLGDRLSHRPHQLSGGEKQRVAIARALVQARPILVLDEATSALDHGTENRLLTRLEPWSADRIVIVVSHRLAVARWADRVIVLSRGEVVEDGPHDLLYHPGTLYHALWQRGPTVPSQASPVAVPS
jgi:putative ABC transport system ATP-binding protein